MKNFSYFYNGLAPSFLKFLWTFEDQGDSALVVDESPLGLHNGIAVGSPWSFPNSADLGTSVSVMVESGELIDQTSFTFLVDAERYENYTTVFLDTLQTGAGGPSGLVFGWSSNGKIFCQTKNSAGENFCHTFRENQAVRNIFGIKKTNNLISLYYFDPQGGDILSKESVNVPSNFNLESSSIVIGNDKDNEGISPDYESYCYLYHAAWLGGAVGDNTMKTLFSGLLDYSSLPATSAGSYSGLYENIEVVGDEYSNIGAGDLAGLNSIFASGFAELGALTGETHFKAHLTGDINSSTLSYVGTHKKLLRNLTAVSLGGLSGGGSTGGDDATFTGDFEYTINSKNEVMFAAQINYESASIGPITFNKETFGSGNYPVTTGSVVKASIPTEFKMRGATITNPDVDDFDTLRIEQFQNVRPSYFNKVPKTGQLDETLLVDGEPYWLFEDRVLQTGFSYSSNKVTLSTGIPESAPYYVYDVEHGQSPVSSGDVSTPYTYALQGTFYKNSSVLKTISGGNEKRLILGVDYEESDGSSFDLIYFRPLAHPSGVTEILDETSTYWQPL